MKSHNFVAVHAIRGGFMARSRNIKPGFFVNDELTELDPLTRLLFAGLWCIADRAGRLLDRPKRIKLEVLPADECDIDAMLWDLHRHGFIVRYECGGANYVEILQWAKHQRPHHTEKHSTFPPSSAGGVTIKPPPVKEHGSLTVKQPLDNGKYPPDSLIPDSLIPDSLKPKPNPKRHTSSSPQKNDDADPETVGQVFAYWQKIMDSPRSALDDKRRKVIRRALASYSPADVCKAIRGCSKSAWHMGGNEKGTKFNGLDLILRDAEKIDAFIAMDTAPPQRAKPTTIHDERAATIAALTGRTKRHDGPEPFTIDAA